MTTSALRMPVSTAARKGISAVAASAAEQRIVLTSLGRPVAVVDSAERLDDAMRALREGARDVIEAYAEVAQRRPSVLNLSEVCARLGLDESAVHTRAAELRAAG